MPTLALKIVPRMPATLATPTKVPLPRALALLVVLTHAWITPPTRQITQEDINAAVLHTLASNTLPSVAANRMIRAITGVRVHDYGCMLKAYRGDVARELRLYGEMHRFIPIYASWYGGKITELPVRHHPRRFGTSKYGFGRIVKVVLDLLVVKFLEDFNTKPIYVFGVTGVALIVFSGATFLTAVGLRVFQGVSFISTPLLLLVAISFITGTLCVLLGLLAELSVRIYYEAPGKATYEVGRTMNIEPKLKPKSDV